jgi:hypothetical protein
VQVTTLAIGGGKRSASRVGVACDGQPGRFCAEQVEVCPEDMTHDELGRYRQRALCGGYGIADVTAEFMERVLEHGHTAGVGAACLITSEILHRVLLVGVRQERL